MAHHDRGLALPSYRRLVALDDPFTPVLPGGPTCSAAADTAARNGLVCELLGHFAGEAAGRPGVSPDSAREAAAHPRRARRMLRALLTVRGAAPIPANVLVRLDTLLGAEAGERTVSKARALPRIDVTVPETRYRAADQCALWRGDITALAADAVVNAANKRLLGCFRPFHPCIDNALHTAAGPRMREDCARIIAAQGHAEPTGTAKITRGYHLPARYVIHTVGPIVDGPPHPSQRAALASSYRACLDLAAEADVRVIALCAVSTGEFGFPKQTAARIALRAVGRWLDEHPGTLDLVVFDVFSAADHALYTAALRTA